MIRILNPANRRRAGADPLRQLLAREARAVAVVDHLRDIIVVLLFSDRGLSRWFIADVQAAQRPEAF